MKILFQNIASQIEDGIVTSFSEFTLTSPVPLNKGKGLVWNTTVQLIVKRFLDIGMSSIFILISFPIMSVIAVLIKVSSKGPVFFTQERVGHEGRVFRIVKFRTMRPENSQEEHREYIQNLLKEDVQVDNGKVLATYFDYIDNRVTSIGRFLRASSLDELPQLFNIFMGHMSLVGPRPHPVYEVQEYKDWYRRRLHVKPGLTGWSKLNLRLTPQNYEESILYDLWYVDNRSILLDLKILLMTVPFVLSMKDAH